MSSTWFRGVRAISCELECGTDMNNPYKRTGYILIADTAESNVTTDSGAHPYSEWIYAAGEYDEVMKNVCRHSYNFETGADKWKPHHKDAAGFIRICKKALEGAKQQELIPCGIFPSLLWNTKDDSYKALKDLLRKVPTVQETTRYGDTCFTTDFVETYIRASYLVGSVMKNYRETVFRTEEPVNFDKWFNKYIGDSSYWRTFVERLMKVGGTE